MRDHGGAAERGAVDGNGPFAVECPTCRAHVAVARDLVGRAAACPACGAAFLVPAPATASPARHVERPAAHEEPVPDEGPIAWHDPPPPVTRQRREAPPAAAAETAVPGTPAVDSAVPEIPAAAADTAGSGGFAFREPVKTIRSGGVEIELRRLTAEEKRVLRARRNLLLLVVGAALLVALVMVLSRGVR